MGIIGKTSILIKPTITSLFEEINDLASHMENHRELALIRSVNKISRVVMVMALKTFFP